MSRTQWSRKQLLRGGAGHGDQILATTNDPAHSWYWREVTPQRGFYNFDFKARPGIVSFREKLVEQYRDVVLPEHVLIEPHVKRTFSADNKDWGFHRWQTLVLASIGIEYLQCVPPGQKLLGGVKIVRTPTFEHAVAALSIARGIVTTAGGLHHAAAALGKPAVVIWGAYAPPEVLGYDSHVNIAERDHAGLGWRINHPACQAAMERIEIERVARAVESVFSNQWSNANAETRISSWQAH